MLNRIYIFALVIFWQASLAQDCTESLSGQIKDLGTHLPMSWVNVYIEETGQGVQTDSNGYFKIHPICFGDYHINLSHIGCEDQRHFVSFDGSTGFLEFNLKHSQTSLNEYTISGEQQQINTQKVEKILKKDIIDKAYESLANMIEDIPGISSLKTGTNISKPVIQGLYGSRVSILNNGVTQSGQQWGNDHSPEIDPLLANSIRVIKGASALEYLGSNLGGVILVEPGSIINEPHLHGRWAYYFESNGIGNGAHLELQKHSPKLAWKANATFKKVGDRHTPDYFLTNTGSQEINLSAQFEKSFSKRWFSQLYFSSFNTEIGILRGAHVGNLTDLDNALEREIPFYTKDHFSYEIVAPRQQVNHQLLKWGNRLNLDEEQKLEFNVAAQYNRRKEYDVRRNGRSIIPSFYLNLFSLFGEGKYTRKIGENRTYKTGLQANLIQNRYDRNTGITPLIPDYNQYEIGSFFVWNQKHRRSEWEFGIRYDYQLQKVAAISRTLPAEVIFYSNDFHNLSGLVAWGHKIGNRSRIFSNIGYASRNPGVNELFSRGLHQGVGAIEEGNLLLEPENSIKASAGIQIEEMDRFSIDLSVYYQNIYNFIYLRPEDEIRLTIRGAFPVYKYNQTQAEIYGLDFQSTLYLNAGFNVGVNYNYLRGQNKTESLPLINMPSNQVITNLNWESPQNINIGKTSLENLQIKASYRHVFEQNRILPIQDYVDAPPAYSLVDLEFSTFIQLKKNKLQISLRVDNLLNQSYRDYLDRMRYYADAMGRNIIFGLNSKF